MSKKSTASKDESGNPVRARVEVKHEFTADELKEIGSEAARAYQLIQERHLSIKAAQAVAKSAIKDLEAKFGELMNKQSNGYETRTVDALVEFRRKQGKKRLLWNTPGKPGHKTLIREEAMTESDYQTLPMDEPEAKPKDQEPERPAVVAGHPEAEAAESVASDPEDGDLEDQTS
jgi:hypothetical protein